MGDPSTSDGSSEIVDLTSEYKGLKTRATKLAEEFRMTLEEVLEPSKKWEDCQRAIGSPTRLQTGKLLKLVFSIDEAKLPDFEETEVLKELGIDYCKLLQQFYVLLKVEQDEETAKKWKEEIFVADDLAVLALVVFALFVRSRRIAWRDMPIWEDETMLKQKNMSAFLSHRGAELDKDVIASVWEKLKGGSVGNLFFDEESLEFGGANDLQMLVAALYCDHLVMLVSPAFPTAYWPILEYCIGTVRYLHYTKVMMHRKWEGIPEDKCDSKFTTPRFVFFRPDYPSHKECLPGWIRNDPHIDNMNGLKNVMLEFLPFPFEDTSTAVEVEGKRIPQIVEFIVNTIEKKLSLDPEAVPTPPRPQPALDPNRPRDHRKVEDLPPKERYDLGTKLVGMGSEQMWGTVAILGLNKQLIIGGTHPGASLHDFAHEVLLRCLHRKVYEVDDAMEEAKRG